MEIYQYLDSYLLVPLDTQISLDSDREYSSSKFPSR